MIKKKFQLKPTGIKNIKFGKNCIIHEPVNLYNCVLGNNVKIGPFVEIQKNSKIGSGTRVCSHTFICELVTIGNNCFIGHGVTFTNDLFKNNKTGGSVKNWHKTKVGNKVLIGSNATILPVKINDNIIIGAGSVVVNDLVVSGVYAGNPAKLIRLI